MSSSATAAQIPQDVREDITPRRSPARARPWLPSIRLLATLIVVLPAIVVSIALLVIATWTTRDVAEDLGNEIITGTTARVTSHVHDYLDSATRVSDLYARRVSDGSLNHHYLEAWERPMFQDLAANPDIASICFANADGDATWLLHAHGRMELGFVRGEERDKALEYVAEPSGKVDRTSPIRIYHYDATRRPWYQLAIASEGPRWTPIYFWFGETGSESEAGTGYARTLRDERGELLGVLIIDVTLGALSEHLRSLPIAESGYAFIVDEKGLLVAASEGAVNSPQGTRLSPAESSSAAARAVAGLVAEHVGDADEAAPRLLSRRVMVEGKPALGHLTEIQPYDGIEWHVVTVLPEASFLTRAQLLQQRAAVLASGAVAGGLAVGLFLSRRLARPLVRLSEHVARVGEGDFDARLHLRDAAELRDLSEELNRMSGGLRERMRLAHSLAVATQVQQSLLPGGDAPALPGLELAGFSRYCESTGGDYYDFIEAPHLPGKLLLAVGDVTGHGLGSAMLMATARGAVRASTLNGSSPADVMTRVNAVLASDVRHGLFMTMSLVLIEPATRTIRWACAGHDPTIVYHPRVDRFEELCGGDVPLGIEPHVPYHDYKAALTSPGALLLIGTDGIWEARDREGQMFGKHRLRDTIKSHAHLPAAGIARALERALDDFLAGSSIQDDVTFIVAKLS